MDRLFFSVYLTIEDMYVFHLSYGVNVKSLLVDDEMLLAYGLENTYIITTEIIQTCR